MARLDETVARVKSGHVINPTREIIEAAIDPVKITVGGKPIIVPHALTAVETELLGNLKRIDSIYGSGFKNRYIHRSLTWLMDNITQGNVPL